jgi:NAD(P)-dependent dehydrogenase (short-subunit alcohol dehydrogenase family)
MFGPRLAGKIALITGAGMGQGQAEALLFAKHGARVIVADINHDAALSTVDAVRRDGGEAFATMGDVAAQSDVKRIVEDGVAHFGGLHILYNNAGVLWKDRDKSVIDTEEEWWDRVMGIT